MLFDCCQSTPSGLFVVRLLRWVAALIGVSHVELGQKEKSIGVKIVTVTDLDESLSREEEQVCETHRKVSVQMGRVKLN